MNLEWFSRIGMALTGARAAGSASNETNERKENKTKNKIDIKNLIHGAFLGAIILLSAAAATTFGSRTAWEYQTVSGKALEQETRLGQTKLSTSKPPKDGSLCRHKD